jgi:hypothetical protein
VLPAVPRAVEEAPPALDGVSSDTVARPTVSLAEALSLALASAIGVISVVSLALAHVGHHTLINVAIGSAALCLAAGAIVVRLDLATVRPDLGGLAPTAVGAGLAALFFFPGFQYGTGDRDPGVYVETGVAIARTHGLPFTDDLVVAGLPGGSSPGAEWPGLWDQPGHPGQIFPQFYHLWPALLATAKDLGGYTGLFDTGPLVGVIAVALSVAVGRRICGLPGAWAVALVLPTNMLEVWQAKYPTAEIFGQMLFMAAVLGVVLAVRSGWRTAAAASGVLVSLGYLERPDGVLMVLFAWVVLGGLYAAGRFDARAVSFTAGMVALLPYGAVQAYHLARNYTLGNGIPRMSKVVFGMLVVAVVAAVLGWQRRRWQPVRTWLDRRTVRLALGSTFIAVCAVLVLVGGLRPRLFGVDYGNYLGRRIRSFNEISFIRLTWFFSLPGIALMCAGIAYVGWRRWRLDRWLVALVTTGLLTLYCYDLRNSPYLMWSTRRFVTTVVPGMVLLMGCGATGIVVVLRRTLARNANSGPARALLPVAPVAALIVGLAVFGTSQSWPLRQHNENGGAIGVERTLTTLSGGQTGVYLWQHGGLCCAAPYQLFGGPMFATMGQSSALLPAPGGFETAAIRAYLTHFQSSGRPVFYVAAGRGGPPAVSGVTTRKVIELAGVLPHWAETYTSRPKTTSNYAYDFTVYRLALTPGG